MPDPQNLPKWKYRERCLTEKGEQCIECGSEENILVHHVDGNRDNNDIDNLVPICELCHNEVHQGSDKHSELVRKLGKIPKPIGEGITLSVTDQTWKQLNERKVPGETFDDVITKLLEEN